MIVYIAAQATYHSIEVGVFSDLVCIARSSIAKRTASKMFIPVFQDLLAHNNLTLADCSFIAASQGPAPFTTLRTLIASLNAVHFATKIPLVGVNGLHAFAHQSDTQPHALTIVLLNAYHNDVYFVYRNSVGCQPIAELIQILQKEPLEVPLRFVGNGAILFEEHLKKAFAGSSFVLDTNNDFTTLETIAQHGLTQWHNKFTTQQLVPLYLKPSIAHRSIVM